MTVKKEYEIVGAILGAVIGYLVYSYYNSWQYGSEFELWNPILGLVLTRVFFYSPIILAIIGWYVGNKLGAYMEIRASQAVIVSDQAPSNLTVAETPKAKNYVLKSVVIVVVLFFATGAILQQAANKRSFQQKSQIDNEYKATLDENGRTPAFALELDLQNNAHKIIQSSVITTSLPDKSGYNIDFEIKGSRSGAYEVRLFYQTHKNEYLDIQFYSEILQLEPGTSKHSISVIFSEFEENFRKKFPKFQGKEVLIDSTANVASLSLYPLSEISGADEFTLGKYSQHLQIPFSLRIKLLTNGGYELVPGERNRPWDSPDVIVN
jgi:hypothetical protein